MTWNIEGLKGAISNSPETDPLLDSDFVCLQETFVDEIVENLRALLPKYNWTISPAFNIGPKLRQGIAILSKQHLQTTVLSKSKYHLAVRTESLNILTFYFPPSTEVDNILLQVIQTLSNISHDRPTILCGDFNCRADEGSRGRELIETLKNYGFNFCSDPNVSTYVSPNGNSCIDFIFHNLTHPEAVEQVRVKPTLERKHQRITCRIILSSPGLKNYRTPPKLLPRKINQEQLVTNLIRLPSPDHVVNENVQQITSVITELIVHSIPKPSKFDNHHKRWFDKQCSTLKKKSLQLKQAASNTGDYSEFKMVQRKYKDLIKKKKQEYDEKELLKRIEDYETAPWLLFKVRTPSLPSPIDVNVWTEHFSNLYNPNQSLPSIPDLDDLVPPEERNNEEWYNTPFNEYEVFNILSNTSSRKAPGPDGICYEHLKLSSNLLLPVLTWLFNICLLKMEVPETWRVCNLKTLYKHKGERDNPNNYRGIALLNTLLKILTGLVHQRLLRIFHMLPADQFGFQPSRNTRQPVAHLINIIKNSLQSEVGKLYVLFVDFHKAFDVVNRSKLINKLKHTFHIKGRTLGLITSILKYNYIQISDGTLLTDPVLQTRGVQQGDSLSPTLFIMYIADLSSYLEDETGIEKQFYADDLEAHSLNRTDIQNALNSLSQWCSENDIQLNESKTKVVKFRNGGRLAQEDKFTYRDSPIEVVSSYEYLGITLQSKLTFTEHILKIKRKCAAVIGTLTNLHLVSLICAIRIFDMKIKPMITYCLDLISEHLTFNHLVELDKTKSMFLKRALSVHSSASSTLIHELVETSFLCEELHDAGNFVFAQEVWTSYRNYRSERRESFRNTYGIKGPAFQFQDWKKNNQKNRHWYTRATAHGFHHLLCISWKCFQPSTDCKCILCFLPAEMYHINDCCFKQDSLPQFVMFLLNLRGEE